MNAVYTGPQCEVLTGRAIKYSDGRQVAEVRKESGGCEHPLSEHDRYGCHHVSGVDQQCGCLKPFGRLDENATDAEVEAEQKKIEFGESLWDEKGRPVRPRFVEALMADTPFIAVRDNGDLFFYKEGYYSPHAVPHVRSWVEDRFRERGETSSAQFISEVVEAIRRRAYRDRRDFNPSGKLCLANGILDLATLTVSPHSPKVPFTFRLPVGFDQDAKCPTFDRFLAEVLPVEADRSLVLQFFGYCLEPGNPYQVALLLEGAGNNGKSTLLAVLRTLLGSESVSSETLQSLSEGRFATASLWGKLANICPDIPASPIRYTGKFKLLTGGDPLQGEHKFAHSFSFTNQAKLIFSANELPPVLDDTSYAFWRRWLIVGFRQDFTGREDRTLSERLQAELPGILNRAIEGLRKLRENHGFPTSRAGDLKEEWKRRSEPLYAFVQDQVETVPDSLVRKDDFYEAFFDYATERNLPTPKPEEVGKRLPKYIPSVRSVRHRVPNPDPKGREKTVAVPVWYGIRLKTNSGMPSTPRTPSTAWGEEAAGVRGVGGVQGDSLSVPALEESHLSERPTLADRALGNAKREGSLAPEPPSSNPYYYPPGGYKPGEAPATEIAVEGAPGVRIWAGEVFYDPPAPSGPPSDPPPPSTEERERWRAEWERDDGDPSALYPGGVLARRFADPSDNVLYRPPEGVWVVHEASWETAGSGATIIYSDGAVVRRSSGEVIGRFRVAEGPP